MGSVLTRRAGAVAVVLAATLTGCSAGAPAPKPAPVPSGPSAPPAPSGLSTAAGRTAASALEPNDPAQELAQLRTALEAPPQPFSAVLTVELTDGTLTARRQGVVNVSDGLQTGALGLVSVEQQTEHRAYLTVTRDATFTRTSDRAWVRSPRSPEPLFADHRAMAQALLQSDPASFRGLARIRTMRGGMGFHLVGRLPLTAVTGAFDAAARERLTQHRVPDCTADLLLDADGRLSELTLTCEADGYRLRSTTGLAEFGPAADTPPPTDL
ncbi:hypothetical protein ACIQF6_33320 [Kitasatospora sp. NPDC092948]|uniref:hypothetical protein n=1 Tax=Kitasatospora sp. NPDC092948 TaxID=3364088 RepID=UPI0038239CB8